MQKLDINVLDKLKEGAKQRIESAPAVKQNGFLSGNPDAPVKSLKEAFKSGNGAAFFNKIAKINEKVEEITNDPNKQKSDNISSSVVKKPMVQNEREFVEAGERDNIFEQQKKIKLDELRNATKPQVNQLSEDELLAKQIAEMDRSISRNKPITQQTSSFDMTDFKYQIREIVESALKDIILEMYTEEKIKKVVKDVIREMTQAKKKA